MISQCLNDLKSQRNNIEKQNYSESFNWLFRDKNSFPQVSHLLGYDPIYFRKKLIKFIRGYNSDNKFSFAIKNKSGSLIQITSNGTSKMVELEKLTHKQLQQLAKEKGLNCKGLSTIKIIELIKQHAELALSNIAASEQSFCAEEVPVPQPKFIINPNDIQRHTPIAMKINMEHQKIVDECNELFSSSIHPSAVAKLSKDAEGIEFRGGPKQSQYLTIHQPRKTLLHFAKAYVAKVTVEKIKKDENGDDIYVSDLR